MVSPELRLVVTIDDFQFENQVLQSFENHGALALNPETLKYIPQHKILISF